MNAQKVHDYQQKLFQQVCEGFRAGETMIIAVGSQTGKSMYRKMLMKYDANLCKEILLTVKVEPKYQFSRTNWYEAEFDDKNYFEVEAWCTEHFGPHPKYPDAWSRWVHKYSEKIHFRDERDYFLFVLRWA